MLAQNQLYSELRQGGVNKAKTDLRQIATPEPTVQTRQGPATRKRERIQNQAMCPQTWCSESYSEFRQHAQKLFAISEQQHTNPHPEKSPLTFDAAK